MVSVAAGSPPRRLRNRRLIVCYLTTRLVEYMRERTGWVTMRIRPLERHLLNEAARQHGETVSGFARTAALQEARRVLGEQQDRRLERQAGRVS